MPKQLKEQEDKILKQTNQLTDGDGFGLHLILCLNGPFNLELPDHWLHILQDESLYLSLKDETQIMPFIFLLVLILLAYI